MSADLERLPRADERPTLSVPDAGRLFLGLGRAASYAAARRGELPVLRFGARRLRVSTAEIRRLVGLDAVDQAP